MIIPITDTVILPNIQFTFLVEHMTPEELKHMKEGQRSVVLLPLKQSKKREDLTPEDFYSVGVLAQMQKVENENKGYSLQMRILERVEASDIFIEPHMINGYYRKLEEVHDLSGDNQQELLAQIKNSAGELAGKFQQGAHMMKYLNEITDLNEIISVMTQFMELSISEKYALMETSSLKKRGMLFSDYLVRYKESIKFRIEMSEKFNEKKGQEYREVVLKQQLRAIQEELSNMNPEEASVEERFRKMIEDADMPEEAKAEANRHLDKMKRDNFSGHEYGTNYDYLELLCALPWQLEESKPIHISKARQVLEEQHYGLEKVKDRILQHLAVMRLKGGQAGSILLLVGPPGTGKTSIGKSIAEALGREYVRVSLGGIKDESDIRGHRKTYVGAMPGRIIQGYKKAKALDPVMVLDEIDKLAASYNGDPASALLEVLDPEQNSTFTDHYMNVPYDLSHTLFICTANSIDTIPKPLLDRMEAIQISGYTPYEKFQIGKRHLISKAIQEHGMEEKDLQITDDALKAIISDYTVEAGVRNLKRQIDAVCRNAAAKIVETQEDQPLVVEPRDLDDMLGRKVAHLEKLHKINPAGVVTGLAWTPVGGDILSIEATSMPGSGNVILTGQLGDVMKESATISTSLLKSMFVMEHLEFKDKDIHIHVPAGAVPKDGPSAGVTLLTALVSLVTGIPVDPKLAMTGEISLRGSVMPIGGLKEKLLAAERVGVTKVLIPKDNVDDLKEVPDEIKEKLTIRLMDSIGDVIKEAVGIQLPKMQQSLFQTDLSKEFVGSDFLR